MSTAVKQFHEEEQIGKTYDWQVARRLFRYLKPYVKQLIPALVLTLLLNLLGTLQPKFTQYAIDWFIIPKKTNYLTLFVLIYLSTQFLRLVFSYFQSVLLNSVGQYVMFDLRREIYDKLQHQEVAYYDRNPVGRIMTRLTADVDALNELFTSGVTDLLGDLVMIVAIIAVMIYMDWRLTLITLLIVLTGGGPLGATTTLSFEVFRGTVQAVNIGPTAVYSIAILLANIALGVLYMRVTGRVTA